MKEPVFLGLDEVVEIHRDQIERYGGHPGIRDVGLLKSAVAMPAAGSGEDYFHTDIHEMAAAYLFHIVRNHPFVDGNKRTGAVAAVVFLMMNGGVLHAGEASFEKMVRSVAEGDMDKAGVAKFFRAHSRKKGRK
ncbi:MAG: type II toxin-antitoxin system death-on-curing family toxin [Thermodesulfovibrionales bacterium]|nr:type II toxin-antitoxin system death-on-curing family toxin [Thermodesulfovibrionales bacterium]